MTAEISGSPQLPAASRLQGYDKKLRDDDDEKTARDDPRSSASQPSMSATTSSVSQSADTPPVPEPILAAPLTGPTERKASTVFVVLATLFASPRILGRFSKRGRPPETPNAETRIYTT